MCSVLEGILEKFLSMFEEVLAEIEDFPPKKLESNSDYYGSLSEFERDQEEDWDEGEGGDDDGKGEKPPKASKGPKEAKKPREGKVDQWHSSRDYYMDRLPLPVAIPEFKPRSRPHTIQAQDPRPNPSK
ncbi:hypothetical protein BGX30_010051 [Mortierella sp. GBA39]|nr:hypothetical protein BGX30_010051 [Mortierella sp. GBA39]